MEIRRVSIMGLGKLGIPIAVGIASRGFEVVGVDIDKSKIDSIKKGISPIYEPGVQDFLTRYREKIEVTGDYRYAVQNTQVSIVIVPTPSTADGSFTSKYVLSSCQSIAEVLRGKEYHLIAICSTVMPGTCELELKPAIEKTCKKVYGEGFGLCYAPEFLAIGRLIQDFLHPSFLIIGESDKGSGGILERFYHRVCISVPNIARMNLINAEITKIALNNYITTKISFANTLAELCEKIPGADADVITSSLGLDYRVNPNYFRGRLSFGGECFPRDQKAFQVLARKLGCQSYIAEAVDRVNDSQCPRIASVVMKQNPKQVMVLGLSFKPNTDVTTESPGLKIKSILEKEGISTTAYDPIVPSSPLEKILDCDVVVVATPWREFKEIPPFLLEGKVVIDCWRLLGEKQVERVKKYIVVGKYIGET